MGRVTDRSRTTLPERSVRARSPAAEWTSMPRRRWEDPDRPRRLEIGVILYAFWGVIALLPERFRLGGRVAVEKAGDWNDSFLINRWWTRWYLFLYMDVLCWMGGRRLAVLLTCSRDFLDVEYISRG